MNKNICICIKDEDCKYKALNDGVSICTNSSEIVCEHRHHSKVIKYAIEQVMIVPANATDDEIDSVISQVACGQDCIWCNGDETLFEFE